MILCLLADATSVHTRRWARYFGEHGHAVHVLSLRQAEIENAWVHGLKPVIPGKTGYVTTIFTVRDLIERIAPDVVHAHYATSYGMLGTLSKFHPYIVSVWGSDVFDFPNKSPLHRMALEFILSSADHVCATSRVMADETHRYCDRPITVTPFGVDCRIFAPAFGRSQNCEIFVVGLVKALEAKYGIDDLLRAFSLVRTQYQGRRALKLVIAGTGSLNERLRRMAGALGIGDVPQLLGFVPHERVPETLREFSVFVCLSIRESFGVSVVEAEACGLPVIVSYVGGLPEVVRDGVTGLVVPAHDPEAAAAAILSLVEDDKRRHELGLAGRRFVSENYEWEENAKRMERLYLSMARNVVRNGQPAGHGSP